jgi:hypothetical protein
MGRVGSIHPNDDNYNYFGFHLGRVGPRELQHDDHEHIF